MNSTISARFFGSTSTNVIIFLERQNQLFTGIGGKEYKGGCVTVLVEVARKPVRSGDRACAVQDFINCLKWKGYASMHRSAWAQIAL
ncbi:hypothetical protein V5799_006438 [Amblyomma americanum]|uniref:Uncharacterized protein n=1 Tax=Amblyomma americanum TaxID=6943 RepID=A0AAQ4DWE4_AMBAM